MKLYINLLFISLFLVGCQSGRAGESQMPVDRQTERTTLDANPLAEEESLESLPEEYQRLTIPYLRNQSFPGSQITIERTVSDTAAYTSYLASYKSEGLRIYGLLTRPKAAVPAEGFPAVVFVHGYIPPLQYQTTEKYVAYVDTLARSGLVVFKIDLRGHGSSQGEPGGAYYSADYIYDTLNAYESLKKLDYVNPESIGLWGHSMAGNVVMRSLAVKPDIPLGVIWAGAVYTYTDMREYGISDGSYQPSQNPNRNRREQLYQTVGEVSSENPFWIQVMPTTYADQITSLIQLHHAVNDPVVSVEYSRNLGKILQAADVNYQLYEYPSGGHNIESPSFTSAMNRTVEAFKEL